MLNMVKYVIATLFIVVGSILGWFKFYNGGLDIQDWASVILLSGGGLGYLLFPLINVIKNFKLPSLKNNTNKVYGSLESDREALDHLMKVGLDNKNQLIIDSIIALNTEIFKIRHKG